MQRRGLRPALLTNDLCVRVSCRPCPHLHSHSHSSPTPQLSVYAFRPSTGPLPDGSVPVITLDLFRDRLAAMYQLPARSVITDFVVMGQVLPPAAVVWPGEHGNASHRVPPPPSTSQPVYAALVVVQPGNVSSVVVVELLEFGQALSTNRSVANPADLPAEATKCTLVQVRGVLR